MSIVGLVMAAIKIEYAVLSLLTQGCQSNTKSKCYLALALISLVLTVNTKGPDGAYLVLFMLTAKSLFVFLSRVPVVHE